MGHRANFVIVEDGEATAYEDHWAALGCTFQLADGPDDAREQAEACEPTDALMDWAFAEGGYLLDFDERVLICFGYPQAPDDVPEEYAESLEAMSGALREGWDAFFRHIAGAWSGWRMVHDGRGVDAFAEHLARRGITSVEVEAPSFPADLDPGRVEVQA